MHRALISLAAVALAFAPQVAMAENTLGVVEAVDYDTGMIFLADGQQFIAEDNLHIEELTVGETVKVAYEASGEDNFAFGVEVVADALALPTSARR